MAADALLGFWGSSPTSGKGRWPFHRNAGAAKRSAAAEPARAARNGGAGRGAEEEQQEEQQQQPPRATRKQLARRKDTDGPPQGRERCDRASALSALCLAPHLPRISRAAEGFAPRRRGRGDSPRKESMDSAEGYGKPGRNFFVRPARVVVRRTNRSHALRSAGSLSLTPSLPLFFFCHIMRHGRGGGDVSSVPRRASPICRSHGRRLEYLNKKKKDPQGGRSRAEEVAPCSLPALTLKERSLPWPPLLVEQRVKGGAGN